MSRELTSVRNAFCVTDVEGSCARLRPHTCRVYVAGSSSGIGKAVALAFATQKVSGSDSSTKICVMSRSKTRLQAVVEEIEALGTQGFAVAGDLTKGTDCQRAVEDAVSVSSLQMTLQMTQCTLAVCTATTWV